MRCKFSLLRKSSAEKCAVGGNRPCAVFKLAEIFGIELGAQAGNLVIEIGLKLGSYVQQSALDKAKDDGGRKLLPLDIGVVKLVRRGRVVGPNFDSAVEFGIGGAEEASSGYGSQQLRGLLERIDQEGAAAVDVGAPYLEGDNRRSQAQIDAQRIDVHLNGGVGDKEAALVPPHRGLAHSCGKPVPPRGSDLDRDAGSKRDSEAAGASVAYNGIGLSVAKGCAGAKEGEERQLRNREGRNG